MRLGFRVTTVVAAALLLAGCGDDGSSDGSSGGDGAGDVTIVAGDFAFDPATIEAAAGETVSVTLQNEDGVEHSITIEELDFDIEAEGGESATGEFAAGEESVEFFCRYHPEQMRGEVSIGGGAGSDEESEKSDDDTGGGLDY